MFTKGYKQTKEHTEKIRKALTGIKQSKEHRIKNGLAKKGNTFRRGSHHTEEAKAKLRKYTGNKASNWRGGISMPDYKEKLAGRKKPDSCEVCGGGGKICFDHDHATGVFRGWLCSRCNFALGQVRDNSELLIALVEYLKKSKGIGISR